MNDRSAALRRKIAHPYLLMINPPFCTFHCLLPTLIKFVASCFIHFRNKAFLNFVILNNTFLLPQANLYSRQVSCTQGGRFYHLGSFHFRSENVSLKLHEN